MPISFSKEEKDHLKYASHLTLKDLDINPNELKFNRAGGLLFLIASKGGSGDYAVSYIAMQHCLEDQEYDDLYCLVVLGDRRDSDAAADIQYVHRKLEDKPLVAGRNGHGPFWWITPDFEYRSPAKPRRR